MEFVNKEYFFLLLLLIPYVMWYFLYRKKTEPTMRMSDTYAYQFAPKSWRIRLIHLPMLLRMLTMIMVIFALARPQTTREPCPDNARHRGIGRKRAPDFCRTPPNTPQHGDPDRRSA